MVNVLIVLLVNNFLLFYELYEGTFVRVFRYALLLLNPRVNVYSMVKELLLTVFLYFSRGVCHGDFRFSS